MESENQIKIDEIVAAMLAYDDLTVVAHACINVLQVLLGGAEAVIFDEDCSDEISSISIGTVDFTETVIDWAVEREIEYDYLAGFNEDKFEEMH